VPDLTPDLCIIGMDPAGYDLALASAQLGASVILVPNGRSSADLARDHFNWLDHAALRKSETPQAFAQTLKQAIDIAEKARRIERLAGLNVRIVEGSAAFTAPRSLDVGDVTISARRFVLAIGRRSSAFPGDPAAGLNPLLTDANWPRAVRVVGSDARAVALAQWLSRAGTGVVLDAGETLLPNDDPEAVALLAEVLRNEGVRIVTAAAPAADDVLLMHSIGLSASPPAMDGLALEAAGIVVKAGEIAFDHGLRTANSRIFGVGAITVPPDAHDPGPSQIGHLIGRTLFRKGGSFALPVAVRRIASAPELVTLGQTEAEARAAGHSVTILRETLPEGPGLLKAVLGAKGRILGVTLLGANASALVGVWAAPIARGGTLADLAALPALPGLAADASRLVASVPQRKMLTSPRLQRLLRFLRKFG
jgi:pyruvate/2-oxoglutarate dehydrogenase complex dihydrolipoamide dehydrogenase (E3) component